MKKRIVLLALLCVLCVFLSACGDSFSIVGKWKSVGNYGFGQAQPGAIVIFEENYCNFFSPRDTYSLTKNGSDYTLYTTSFMSTATLSFNVTVKDNNHITIYYNGTATELQRMQ